MKPRTGPAPRDAPARVVPREAASDDGLRLRAGWRDWVRSTPGLGQAYRVSVFVVGLAFIALGIGLSVLPGPLTIPPVLIGLWIWSTEFRFAERLFESFTRRADDAWQHANDHPLAATLVTIGGLAAAGAVAWAVFHYELIDKSRSAIGI